MKMPTVDSDPVLDEIIRRIVSVASPDKIVLFGSRAKGTSTTGSDYDLLVIKGGVKRRRDLAKEIYRNLRGIRYGVDIIVETPESLAESINSPAMLHADAVKEGTVVYG